MLLTDDGRDTLLVFGGRFKLPDDSYIYYNELWLYDIAGESWRRAAHEGPAPLPRDHHAAAKLNNEYFIYAGRVKFTREADAVRSDLWSYSLVKNRWTNHIPANGVMPTARYMPGAAGYSSRDATLRNEGGGIFIFGGETFPGRTTKSTMNDIWYYDLTANEWTQRSHSVCRAEEDDYDDDDDLSPSSDFDDEDDDDDDDLSPSSDFADEDYGGEVDAVLELLEDYEPEEFSTTDDGNYAAIVTWIPAAAVVISMIFVFTRFRPLAEGDADLHLQAGRSRDEPTVDFESFE